MTCKELIRRLSEFLDGELEPELEKAVTRHLEHCEDCHLVFDTTRKTIDILCHTDPQPLPPDVQGRLDRALAGRLGKRPPSSRGSKP